MALPFESEHINYAVIVTKKRKTLKKKRKISNCQDDLVKTKAVLDSITREKQRSQSSTTETEQRSNKFSCYWILTSNSYWLLASSTDSELLPSSVLFASNDCGLLTSSSWVLANSSSWVLTSTGSLLTSNNNCRLQYPVCSK